MKRHIHRRMIRAFPLLLTAVCLTAGIPDADAQTYDSNTTVYVDALWCRVHAADCPSLILKDQKQTMTLEEADQLGYRIGESGQSGREDCCLHGYQRKYYTARNVDAYYDTTYVNPGNSSITTVEGALISEDAIGVVQTMSDGKHKYHVYGCHRFTPDQQDQRMTLADARSESGFYVCQHCIERGPGFAQMSDEEWAKLPSGIPWTPPAGWTPSSFSADTLPPQAEIDVLLSETLHGDIGIQESVYTNPVATVENFMIMRFFFPVGRWLELYQAYRCTGDTNVLEQLRGSARHYNTLSTNYLSAAQKQAQDPEGMAYMYTMAASARITLQLARKYPAHVTAEELAEAEDFVMTIRSVLQPICEGNDNLDPTMGIPQPLADDFRSRAFNRALNGIGTIGMATAALQDLQVLNNTTAYQSTIDRYRLIIQQYITNWKNTGFEETVDGKDYFSYPYSAGDSGYIQNGVKLFTADDQGHFSHSMQGCYVLYDSVPELGVDDAFMTALANTIEFNSHTTSGSPQTPSQEAERPYSRKSFSAPRDRFYLLQAFNDGVIAGQCSKLSASATESKNSEYEYRRATLNAQYLKALRQDRTIIYLGDAGTIPPAAPTGLAATAGDGSVTLDWNDNSESNLAGYSVYRSTSSGSYSTALATNLTSSAYVDTAVSNGTTYYYVVSAIDTNDVESATSGEVLAIPTDPSMIPPAAPAGLAATTGDGVVTLDWDDGGPDVAGYSVYRSTTSGSYGTALDSNLTASAYVDTAVSNDTAYYYVVSAIGTNNVESATSGEVLAVPTDPSIPPPAITIHSYSASDGYLPSNMLDGDLSDQSRWSAQSFPQWTIFDFGTTRSLEGLDVWTLNDRAYRYTLEISDNPSGGFTTVVDRSANTDTTQPISDQFSPAAGRYAKLTVSGVYADGTSWASIREVKFTFTGEIDRAPTAPANLTAVPGDAVVSLDWDDNSELDLAGYSVYRSTASGTNYTLLASNLTSSAHVDSTALNGTPYYYVVTAVDSASLESAQSAEVSATPQADTTPPAAPLGLAATAGDRWVSLDWNDNGEGDLDSYSVYRSITSGSYSNALVTGLSSSYYTDSSVVNDTTYYYVVKAVDTGTNESAQSAEVSVTPVEFTGFSDVIVFGFNNDGLGGCTQSTVATGNFWTDPIPADSVAYTTALNGLYNNSLLKAFTLDRSVGKSYTIKGTLTWSAEADRHNRQGIYLFGHNLDIAAIANGEDATGELSLQYQADNRLMRLQEGLDTTTIGSLSPANAPAVNSYFTDLPFTFQADIAFINTNGTDQIDITCTMIDEFGGFPATNTLSAVVNAADYTGEYFGFAGRTRADGSTTPTDSVVQYGTFSIIESGASALEGYAKWLSDHGVADTAENLCEYAMNSDPTDGLAPTNMPVLSKTGSRFLYIHPQRSDDTNIIYTVETTTNLLDSGSWTNDGYVVIGTNVTGKTLNFVTNDVDTVDSEKFIRLKIDQ